MTPILDSLPPCITISGYHIWLNITKEITGSYSGGYILDLDVPLGFYINNYPTIEELAHVIQNKINKK